MKKSGAPSSPVGTHVVYVPIEDVTKMLDSKDMWSEGLSVAKVDWSPCNCTVDLSTCEMTPEEVWCVPASCDDDEDNNGVKGNRCGEPRGKLTSRVVCAVDHSDDVVSKVRTFGERVCSVEMVDVDGHTGSHVLVMNRASMGVDSDWDERNMNRNSRGCKHMTRVSSEVPCAIGDVVACVIVAVQVCYPTVIADRSVACGAGSDDMGRYRSNGTLMTSTSKLTSSSHCEMKALEPSVPVNWTAVQRDCVVDCLLNPSCNVGNGCLHYMRHVWFDPRVKIHELSSRSDGSAEYRCAIGLKCLSDMVTVACDVSVVYECNQTGGSGTRDKSTGVEMPIHVVIEARDATYRTCSNSDSPSMIGDKWPSDDAEILHPNVPSVGADWSGSRGLSPACDPVWYIASKGQRGHVHYYRRTDNVLCMPSDTVLRVAMCDIVGMPYANPHQDVMAMSDGAMPETCGDHLVYGMACAVAVGDVCAVPCCLVRRCDSIALEVCVDGKVAHMSMPDTNLCAALWWIALSFDMLDGPPSCKRGARCHMPVNGEDSKVYPLDVLHVIAQHGLSASVKVVWSGVLCVESRWMDMANGQGHLAKSMLSVVEGAHVLPVAESLKLGVLMACVKVRVHELVGDDLMGNCHPVPLT